MSGNMFFDVIWCPEGPGTLLGVILNGGIFFCDVNKQLFKNLPYLFSLLVYTTRVENIVTILSEHKR